MRAKSVREKELENDEGKETNAHKEHTQRAKKRARII